MTGGVVASAVAAHTPRIGIEANAPEFARGLIDGLRELGNVLRAEGVELIVLQSAHWVSTFNWYVTGHAVHEGICIADEAPDLIPGVPYRHPGDPDFARALAAALRDGDVPCGLNESPYYTWDYAAMVPCQYIDPVGDIPVVLLPTVICSDLAENRKVGGLVHHVAKAAGKRVAYISSCALSHAVRRGPELWPTPERMELDRRFIELATAARVRELVAWSPEFAKDAVAEMGGRTISGMLGALAAQAAEGGAMRGRQLGDYAQSSGSGNATICFTSKAQ